MELDWDVFDREWQRVAVDKAKPVYKQGEDLLSYAESLQDGTTRLNDSRNAAIAQATQIMRRKPEGRRCERVFSSIVDAQGFSLLVSGVIYFFSETPGYKVVWYTNNIKEVW